MPFRKGESLVDSSVVMGDLEISDQGLRSDPQELGLTQQGPKLWQEIAQTAPMLQLVPWLFPVHSIL